MLKERFSKIILSVSICGLLTACQTTPGPADKTHAQKIDSALEQAAGAAAARGESSQSLGYLEKIYKRNSADPQAAASYAHALRESEMLNEAALVLGPFAKDPASPVTAKTEYAAIQLAQGNYESAEKYARNAVRQDEKSYEAWHYLGIAQDAQNDHVNAEKSFRKALDYWQGDPTTVMNNLALNLAAQGFVDEAAEILHKAKALAPDRIEIERNLRIVMALQQIDDRIVPKPKIKPRMENKSSDKSQFGPQTPTANE